MTAVRQIIDSQAISHIVDLPKSLQHSLVEIKIMPISCKRTARKVSRTQLLSLLAGSITESITGVLPDTNITLEQVRAERLSKYESTD